MSRRIIKVMAIFLIASFTYSLIGCSNTAKKVSTDKAFKQTIDEKLNNITHPKDIKISVSSNPYDYIRYAESNEDYKYIVSQGEKSLNYMLEKFADSNENGLEEYIMAIACAEILEENPNSKNWASGKEWYNHYTEANK